MLFTSAPRLVVEDELVPMGDVALAPFGLTGVPEAELARAMAERLLTKPRQSDAEALTHLRVTFPHSPLMVRLAGIAALMRRR